MNQILQYPLKTLNILEVPMDEEEVKRRQMDYANALKIDDSKPKITELPVEVIDNIFRFLSPMQTLMLGLTCTKMKELARNYMERFNPITVIRVTPVSVRRYRRIACRHRRI